MPFDFTGKVGPLPVWAWGGLIGVGIVGFSYWHSSTRAASAAGTAAGAVPSATVDGIDGAFGGYGSANGGAQPNGTTPTDPNAQPTDGSGIGLPDYSGVDFADTTSLETWIARGVLWLSGQGVSPQAAQQSISDYLAGKPTTGDAVSRVVAQFGPPPLGIDPGTVDLSPRVKAPKPTKTSPGHHWEYSELNNIWINVADKTPLSGKNPSNTPLPPAKPGYATRWNYTTREWEYQKP